MKQYMLYLILIILYSCQKDDPDPQVVCIEVECNIEIKDKFTVLNETMAEWIISLGINYYSTRIDMGTGCPACKLENSGYYNITIPPDTLIMLNYEITGKYSGESFLYVKGQTNWVPYPSHEFTIKVDSSVVSGI